MAQPIRKNVPVVAPDFRMKRGAVDRHNGVSAVRVAQAVFQFGGTDSAGVSMATAAAHGLGVYIPDNAVITKVWIDVVTTFTSPTTDAATIAIHIQSANDVVSAIAINDASNVWDAGIRGSLIGFPNFGADAAHDSALEVAALFAASMLKTTAEREITATVGVEAITAGKAVIYVEYVLGD